MLRLLSVLGSVATIVDAGTAVQGGGTATTADTKPGDAADHNGPSGQIAASLNGKTGVSTTAANAAMPTGTGTPAGSCTAKGRFGIPDDDGTGATRVRVAFRTGADESGMGGNVKHATTGETGGQFPNTKAVTALGGDYNTTTGILTLEKRGGYTATDDGTATIQGPGTLFVTHLDLEAEDDKITITRTDSPADWHDVTLTGNWSACIRMAQLESIYMDKNLAPGSAEGGVAPSSVPRTSTHDTEETQNHQAPQGSSGAPNNQLCHDVLTGKVLGPAPVYIPKGDTLVSFIAENENAYDSSTDSADGFTLRYVYDDWYVADVSGTGLDMTIGDCTVTDDEADTGADGSPPDTAPASAFFVDQDLNRRTIQGTIHASKADGDDDTDHYKAILEKVQAPGTWGFMLDDNAIIFGPKDTWGRDGSALPYYASGGSSGTDAPSNLIDQGDANGDNVGSGGSLNGAKPNPNPNTHNGGAAPASAGGPLSHHGTGGLVNTAGGGPVGARAFNKHGDVISGSARGNHPDYWEEEVVEVRTYDGTTGSSEIVIGSTTLEKSQGSPPSPLYRFKVVTCNSSQKCTSKRRAAMSIQVVDIGMYEPKAVFYGDLDPKSRVLAGEITVTTPAFAMGVQGYRFYPTSDGNTNLELRWSDTETDEATGDAPTKNAQFALNLHKSCPPDQGNDDWAKFTADTVWEAVAREPCGNDNPYSPKCRGKSCAHVNILPGSQGEFYISRYDNNGNAENPDGAGVDDGVQRAGGDKTSNLPQEYTSNTARRNYGDNEYAFIYLPKSGWLTPILMDVANDDDGTDDGDTLMLYRGESDSTGQDLKDATASPLSNYIDLSVGNGDNTYVEESGIEWKTDSHRTSHGWTLIYQPNYPELLMNTGTPMAQGASGFRVVTVYGSADAAHLDISGNASGDNEDTRQYLTEYRANGEDGETGRDDRDADAYVETADWLVPNVTCTPTTMHCPLPSTWAHINYTTPSLYPEPAEGSCLQQKTGTSSLSGCSDKTNLNTRWYSANSPTTRRPGNSLKNTDEEDNGQAVAADTFGRKHANWAGNCGDATSYFWFEKIACGSSRTFHTDRSLIEDFVQLTPTWEDIQQILDLYYTTKAPLKGDGSTGPGFTFINADYHVAPVLPPKVNCSCMASMDAYASLLSVVSKTPTPGAPVTLDPEVLNTGTSKMVATLRMYQDPTYSIPASSEAAMPIVVSRFYLEVSTKFTRNRITISDCTSAHVENSLNATDALKPRLNYCDNSTFDTQPERSPSGVTHMDRLSMKKFKYQGTTDVFMQCKIRACAQQPCGVCTGSGDPRQLSTDLSPAEGEMFAPPVSVRLAQNDPNALVFGQPTGPIASYTPSSAYSAPAAPAATQTAAVASTSKPIEVRSQMTLSSVTPEWAVANRAALTATLRTTLALQASEELVIVSITAARRLSEQRKLQSGGVKIDFSVGLDDPARAAISQNNLAQLATGSPAMLSIFVSQLDTELESRGAAKVGLSPEALTFAPPTRTRSASGPSSYYAAGLPAGLSTSEAGEDRKSESGSANTMLFFVGGIAVAGVAFFAYQRGKAESSANLPRAGEQQPGDDVYASKVSHFDDIQNQFEMDAHH